MWISRRERNPVQVGCKYQVTTNIWPYLEAVSDHVAEDEHLLDVAAVLGEEHEDAKYPGDPEHHEDPEIDEEVWPPAVPVCHWETKFQTQLIYSSHWFKMLNLHFEDYTIQLFE